MDFDHSEERQMLVDTLGRYLKDRYDFAARDKIANSEDGWSREHWQALAELGVVGVLFDEAAGGFGGTGWDVGAVFSSVGASLVVEPFLGTLMAGRVLAKTGQSDLLGQVIGGEKVLAFAHEEPQSRYELTNIETRAENKGGAWTLTGHKSVVAQLAAADHVVASARTGGSGEDGLSLFLVDRKANGVAIRDFGMIDGGRGGELELKDAPAILLGEAGKAYPLIEDAVAAGIVALVIEAVAVMDQIKAQTLEYLRTRKQFGVPIGKFQALQHRMATVALEIEQARSSTINAAAALDGDRLARERAVSAAKYTIGRVGTLVAEEAIQMHGGMGLVWELPLSHYAKRLTMIGHQLGDEDHHLDRYIALGRKA